MTNSITFHGIKNVSESALSYRYLIVMEFPYDHESWYYGADNDPNRANEIAMTLTDYEIGRWGVVYDMTEWAE
jgi:hypothetical protein